ncbi:MAG: hydantoinase/oxoprolinase family protein [Nitrospirales bacterium]|nr:hydantoinase/oxoprolinase family protein [Nitrospira sp.]MDR4500617.1 hydantoinase/oxoprolinase family protein [Nitrospirales bacterium]
MKRIGIDIGGTFTDFVVADDLDGSVTSFKRLSSPSAPERTVLEGLRTIHDLESSLVVHGSTVATNALLERNGATTALLTTKGFRDLLQIGRQSRERLYDLSPQPPVPLVPPERCFEVTERVDHRGKVLIPLNMDEVRDLIPLLRENQIESVAVSFLFSFLLPEHEQKVAACLRDSGFFVTASHELVPEFREYERTSTTTLNSYVSPVLDRYLAKLERDAGLPAFHILQSNGGRLSVLQARGQGVRSILSGPAGGVVGARYVARLAGYENLITFDMGGTSTDVSLVNGHPQVTHEAKVDGLPIRIPVLDIHSVGSGGGSIAHRDAGGGLRVGPRSAGADPGPVCYGRGGRAVTVTDANVMLGRLPDGGLLNGTMKLACDASVKCMDKLANELVLPLPMGLSPRQALALGIVQVVNAHMERAIRVISVERGYDPRDYTLVSFGGAGGLHACDLARQLAIPRILVAPQASTLSALGMLTADVQRDYVQTIMLSEDIAYDLLEDCSRPLVEQGMEDLSSQDLEGRQIEIIRELDIRYLGQSFELSVPLTRDFRTQFDRLHHARYGVSHPDDRIELVNIRVRAFSLVQPPVLPSFPVGSSKADDALWCERPVVLQGTVEMIPHYHGVLLNTGCQIQGPALIVQEDTTIYLGSTDVATVDGYRNLIIHVGT